jgi:hypothetical protein
MERTPCKMNASIVFRGPDKKVYCTNMLQIIDGKVYRYNGVWSHLNGLESYHTEIFLPHVIHTLRIGGEGSFFRVFFDDGDRYYNVLKGKRVA